MFFLVLVLCAVTSAYRCFLYLGREQALTFPKFCSARPMVLASVEAASREFKFEICIILPSLCVRDLREKARLLAVYILLFLSIFTLLFYLSMKEIYISFLDLLERIAFALWLFQPASRELIHLVYTVASQILYKFNGFQRENHKG